MSIEFFNKPCGNLGASCPPDWAHIVEVPYGLVITSKDGDWSAMIMRSYKQSGTVAYSVSFTACDSNIHTVADKCCVSDLPEAITIAWRQAARMIQSPRT